MAANQEDDELADIFGDFDSGDEAPAKSVHAADSQPAPHPVALPLASQDSKDDDEMKDIFGDFDSEDDTATQAPRKRLRKAAQEDAPGGQKRKRRDDVSKYFEQEAEEAGGSGDEEEDGDLQDFLDDTGADAGEGGRAKLRKQMQNNAELEEVERDMADRAGERGMARSFGSSFLDRMEEKYRNLNEQDEPVEAAAPAAPSPGALSLTRKDKNTYIVPDPKDPKLWCVKTFAPEKELVLALLIKAGQCFAEGKPVQIYSAFFSPHLRGYIYIEAWKEAEVREFVKGIRGISQWFIRLVPGTQMPQVFKASFDHAEMQVRLKKGDWIRLKRGPYKGDLGMVDEVRDQEYVVKVKPRLNYGADRMSAASKKDKKYQRRPVPRWFNRHDVEAGGLVVNTERRLTSQGCRTFFLVEDEVYRDGFLYKTFKEHALLTGEHVRAQEHEIQDWKLAPPPTENTRPSIDLDQKDDAKMMPPPVVIPKKTASVQRVPLVEGDIVIVTTGDLKNLRGTVTQVITGNSNVLVMPMGVEVKREISIDTGVLSKYFEVGDYVKAVSGENVGDVGYITKVVLQEGGAWGYNAYAKVLSSGISGEFKARIDHLQITAQKSDPQDKVGEFAVGQLVRLDGRTNGLVVRMEANARAIVLTTDGKKHIKVFGEMEPVALPNLRAYRKNTWTLDRKGQKIYPGCVVKAPRSTHRTAPIQAEVLNIQQHFVFLKAVEAFTGEKAYMVCPGQKCEFVWNRHADEEKKEQQKKEEKNAENQQGMMQYGIQMASEINWIESWCAKMLGINKKDSFAQGRGVRIQGGAYKGLRGEVRDYLGDKVRVSLLSKPKLVTVPASFVVPDDYENPRKNRWPVPENSSDAVPTTPPAEMMTAAPATPIQGAVGEEHGAPSEENSWDPNFLMVEPQPPDATSNPALGEVQEHPATPVPVIHDRTSETPRTPVVEAGQDFQTVTPVAALVAQSPECQTATSERESQAPRGTKRRKSRIPPAIQKTYNPGIADAFSPSSRTWLAERESRVPWLIVGLGIRYMDKGKQCRGWIVRVYTDMAHVVPETAAIGDDSQVLTFQGSETNPWPCEKRGDSVVVYDGPRRGAKGKIIGFEKSTAYIRLEGGDSSKDAQLFQAASAEALIHANKSDIARYSPEWEKAADEKGKGAGAAAPANDAVSATSPRTDPPQGESANKAWWEHKSPARPHESRSHRSGEISVTSSGVVTPGQQGAPATPISVEENTPLPVVVEGSSVPTPGQLSATPMSVEITDPWRAALEAGGELSVSLSGSHRSTPTPATSASATTTVTKEGYETPIEQKQGGQRGALKESGPGDAMPVGDSSQKQFVGGEDTPLLGLGTPKPMIPEGDSTPALPLVGGEATPLAKGDQTPRFKGEYQTPDYKDDGEQTPWGKSEGGATPSLKREDYYGKAEGEQTPLIEKAEGSGEQTPLAGMNVEQAYRTKQEGEHTPRMGDQTAAKSSSR